MDEGRYLCSARTMYRVLAQNHEVRERGRQATHPTTSAPSHSGIAFITPADDHHHRIDAVLEVRRATLDAAYAAHPERFVRGAPIARRPPAAVSIKPPKELPPTQTLETDAH